MQEGAADGGRIAQQVAGNSAAPAGRRLTYSADTFQRGKKQGRAVGGERAAVFRSHLKFRFKFKRNQFHGEASFSCILALVSSGR